MASSILIFDQPNVMQQTPLLMLQKIILAFFLLCSVGATAKDGYKIKVKYADATDSMIYLCHYYGKASQVFKDDSAFLDKSGVAQFQSSKKIVGGIYMLLFADKTANMEIILLNGDDFSIQTAKTDVYNKTTFKGISENENFYTYQKYLQGYGAEYQKLDAELKSSKSKKDSEVVITKMRAKGKELQTYRDDFIKKHPGTFLSQLFNAVYDPEIPTEYPTLPDGSKDSSYPRNVYKSKYWERFDFKDDRIIYSPIYENKLDNYLSKLVVPVPDTVNREADWLLNKCKGTEEVFKYTLWYLTRWTETSKIMGLDESFVYLVENYYMKGLAPWVDTAQLAKYEDRARKIAPNMIGQPAMDMRMIDTTNKNVVALSNVKADYTILIFWSPTCGHCQKEIPQFDSLYHAGLKKYNVKIYAVEADNEEEKWKKFIQEHKLNEGWIHVHDPNHTTNFRAFYDVYSTPTVFLLDDKKIIRGKRIDPKNVLGLIEWLDKKKKREAEKKK
jgi:peroxiredoxin